LGREVFTKHKFGLCS